VIIEAEPINIQSKILPMPTIELANGKQTPCDTHNLKNLPIQKPSEAMMFQRWAIVYERKHFNQANNLSETLQKASQQLNIKVEEPSWIEIDRQDDLNGCEQQLQALIDCKKKPGIVLIMLGNERLYKAYKNLCYSMNLISQCIRYQNFGKGMNLSVASNVLR
jgi:hypothetical protein